MFLSWTREPDSHFKVNFQNRHCVSEWEARSVVHVWIFNNFICTLYLFLHLFSNFLNKLHTIIRIILVFQWIYKPFIFKIFFKISKSFPREEKFYTFYIFGGKTERNEVTKRKHWKFNIAIEGIYFFFCLYGNRPWYFFRCRFFVLFGWISGPCSQNFLAFSLSLAKEVFFIPLQEFVVHFKTGKNLRLTLKNAFFCFWLFRRWKWFCWKLCNNLTIVVMVT